MEYKKRMVDEVPCVKQYATDGHVGYLDMVYSGEYVYNIHSKRDAFTVESVNAALQYYIPTLRRRSKCFPRFIDTFTLL